MKSNKHYDEKEVQTIRENFLNEEFNGNFDEFSDQVRSLRERVLFSQMEIDNLVDASRSQRRMYLDAVKTVEDVKKWHERKYSSFTGQICAQKITIEEMSVALRKAGISPITLKPLRKSKKTISKKKTAKKKNEGKK